MPGFGGLELLRRVRAMDDTVGFIILTGAGTVENAVEALRLQADDYLVKPFNVDEVLLAAERALSYRRLLRENRSYQAHLEERVAEQAGQIEVLLMDALRSLAAAIETRDDYTGGHVERVARYAAATGRELGLRGEELRALWVGALLHDVGKIGVRDEVLKKPGALTTDEYDEMKRHPGDRRDHHGAQLVPAPRPSRRAAPPGALRRLRLPVRPAAARPSACRGASWRWWIRTMPSSARAPTATAAPASTRCRRSAATPAASSTPPWWRPSCAPPTTVFRMIRTRRACRSGWRRWSSDGGSGRMMDTHRLAVVLLLSAAACTPPVRTAPAPAAGVIDVALVDSVPFATEMHDGVLHRVQVRTAAGVDTIPSVLTHALPVVLADGSVRGFVFEAADLRSAFAWHPARPLQLIPLPDDADRWFTTPAFSPDGRYLAYVSYNNHGYGRGMVRDGTAGPVVVRTDSVAVPATDAALSFAKWLDAQTFEIYLDVGETGWHRFAGTVADGVTRNDTVRADDVMPPER